MNVNESFIVKFQRYTSAVVLLCLNAEPYRYQLRAYIYQGRDLFSGDSSGLSGNFLTTFL